MKILLVSPITYFDGTFLIQDKIYNFEEHPFMNLGLLYLGSVAEKLEHEVIIKKAHHSSFKKMIKKYNPDILGITCHTSQYDIAKKIVKIAKDYNKNIIVICGGYFPTFMWKYILNETDLFDYLCIGEGENTFEEWLETIENRGDIKKIRGLAFKENGKIVFTGDRKIEDDINKFLLPARHLLDFNIQIIITSRGCPNKCKFCTIHKFYKGKYRERSIQSIIEELKIMKDMGIKTVHIRDDNFLINKEKIFELAKAVKDNNLKFDFILMSDIRALVDDKVLKIMKELRVKRIRVGIQYNYCKPLNMPITKEIVKNFFAKIKNYDFFIDCFYIVNMGNTSEKIEDVKKEIEDINKLIKDPSKAKFFLNYTLMTPFPGSDIYEEFKNNDINVDFSNWGLLNCYFCIYRYKNGNINEEKVDSLFSKIENKQQRSTFFLKRWINITWLIFSSSLSLEFKIKSFVDFFIMKVQRKSIYHKFKVITTKYF